MRHAGVYQQKPSAKAVRHFARLRDPGRSSTMTSALQTADVRARDGAYQWLAHYPKDVDWHQNFTAAPLYELLDSAVAKYGSKTATNFLGKTLTYKEIGQATARAAAGLQKLG